MMVFNLFEFWQEFDFMKILNIILGKNFDFFFKFIEVFYYNKFIGKKYYII